MNSKWLIQVSSLLLILLVNKYSAMAQSNTLSQQKGLRVSLLTCGTGSEIYSVFGHTAVRIVDSSDGSDIVYNYGTFDGYDEDFEIKFMRGKLLYYISTDPYADFIEMYRMEGRWVEEQLLNTSIEHKKKIQQYLLINMLPENKAYKYDFFFDNCATRIRDIFTQSLGESFKFSNILPKDKSLSFREIINQYLSKNPWERFGINILLGSKIDQKMSNEQIMFLPDYLQAAISKSTLDGQKFVGDKSRIVDEKKGIYPTDRSVFFILYGFLLLTILGNYLPKLKQMGIVINNFWLILSGFLGILILFMWFATDHQTCSQNFNLLWALPTNLFFIFRKKQHKYALIAIILIIASLIIHFIGIQELLITEMLPILLSLLIVFIRIYQKGLKKV
jgi:hypothetical protein